MGEFDNRFEGKIISFRDAQLNYRGEPLEQMALWSKEINSHYE